MDRNPPITKINYKPWLFECVEENFCFLRGPFRWLTAAKNAKCQLASELQDLRVFEKRSKEEVTQSKNATEDQNRICEYMILSNGPLIWKKKNPIYYY